MAKMIPDSLAAVSDSEISNAERRIFDKLKTGPNTSDWNVLHSVKVPGKRERSHPREIDFLIMVPGGGIVCLEVKGDSYTVGTDGKWYRDHGDGKAEPESPDKQAETAMDALHSYLKRKAPNNSKGLIHDLPIWYALAFTAMKWPSGVPVPPGILVCDSSVAQSQEALCKQLGDFANDLPGGRKLPLDGQTMQFIIETLRPDFATQFFLTSGPDLADIDKRLLSLTVEQYEALEDIQDDKGRIRNERVLIEGAAGTGKTMLALQLARLRQKAGDRVAVVCHSPLLGGWLKGQLPGIAAVGQPVRALFQGAQVSDDFLRQYEDKIDGADTNEELLEVGERFCEEAALELVNKDLQWDYLIVDELQYYNHKVILASLDYCLKDGLKNGRWAMFGDFTFQNWVLESDGTDSEEGGSGLVDAVDAKEYLREFCPTANDGKGWFEARPLKINCRNTRAIAQAAARVVGQDAPPVRPSQVGGPEVVFHYCRERGEADRLLAGEFRRLREAGVRPQQVAIVYDGNLPARARLGPWGLWRYSLTNGLPPEGTGDWVIAYETVAFAGMESDVVIYLPVPVGEGLREADACRKYVSMTRAKGALIVLALENQRVLLEPLPSGSL